MNRQNITPVNIEDEMQASYIDYSMSVIVMRALPDVRDGLKPVHRRIIYAMHDEGLQHNKQHSKCAGVVGEVLKKYHPHGDSAVYDALVRMAQDWNLRYPLIDPQGNFGSVDGDAPAAYRYTECRMTAIAELLLQDIEKNTVEFMPNFDGRVMEPTVLPAAFPNLLVNGSAGIAVGMATNIPPHNLRETVTALKILIANPEATLPELMRVIPGPDFPTGGYIYGRAGIREAYETGRGRIQLRARVMVEQQKSGKDSLIVTEIPYQVNKANLIAEIATLARDKKIQGISDIRDESDQNGMRIMIELRKGEVPQVIINQLYKMTQMQVTFGIILLALVDGRPRYLSLKRMLQCYLEHRREVVVRRTKFDLDKARRRIHIVEGLLIAVDNIDEVIKIIRSSSSTDDARQSLKSRFGLTDEQTQAILDMPLRRLTGLEIEKLQQEHQELAALIEQLVAILADPNKVTTIIRDELDAVARKFGDERMTEIVDAEGELTVEDLIAEERMVITVTHSGYIKRTPTSLYRRQRRGGKGASGVKPKEEDWVEHLFVGTTHNYIMFFTNTGKAYWLKVWELPQAGRASRGRPIVNLLALEPGETIQAMIPIDKFSEDRYLVMCTRKGQVVRNSLDLYSNPRKVGIKAINIADDDELIAVRMTNGHQQLLIATREGMAVRFDENDVRPMGRFVGGVRGINLRGDDQVVGMIALRPESTVLTVCEKGYGKRSDAEDYRLTKRGGVGVINIRATERNGKVIAVLDVIESDELILISEQGITIRSRVSDMRVIARATMGVRLMHLEEGDSLVGVARIEEDKSVAGVADAADEGDEEADAEPEVDEGGEE
ncbi:MAG TPA: DNA gyrase subunit A [Candidatus Sumerlaeota bacterium]|nr:DNA gyrase subunit A [Candidatus Sumerlaeota bacterium]HPK02809.1 DNA gyrase subunit A [Candidatus Sumerlaeota bacterium]